MIDTFEDCFKYTFEAYPKDYFLINKGDIGDDRVSIYYAHIDTPNVIRGWGYFYKEDLLKTMRDRQISGYSPIFDNTVNQTVDHITFKIREMMARQRFQFKTT